MSQTRSHCPTTLSLREFILHTEISEAALLSLLDQGVLPCLLSDNGALKIDISNISIDKLATLLLEANISENKKTLVDSKIISFLEPLLEEASTLAFKWLKEDQC